MYVGRWSIRCVLLLLAELDLESILEYIFSLKLKKKILNTKFKPYSKLSFLVNLWVTVRTYLIGNYFVELIIGLLNLVV